MKGQLGGALGRHVLVEAFGCSAEALDNVKSVEKTMVDAALSAGAEIREVAFHKFNPQGVSGVVVISESHLAIHTWPELGYAAIDVFTCGESVNPWDAVDYLIEKFGAESVSANEVKRGIFQKADTKVKVS